MSEAEPRPHFAWDNTLDMPITEAGLPLSGLATLAAELATLKRLRDAQSSESLATRLFRRAWEALLLGRDFNDVALSTTADALAALRLGAMDSAILSQLGVPPAAAGEILAASFDQVAGPIAPAIRAALRERLGEPIPLVGEVPGFVESLIRQPRAGVTCPGRSRIVLEPPEGHGDHCLIVAVLGVALAGHYGAAPAVPFIAGLAHHLHNATMPDSGFAGEMLLGGYLVPAMERLFETTVATLPDRFAEATRLALRTIRNADTPEGQAFNAADVIDRIMEMRHFAAVAAFTSDQALGEMELVHAGPLQAFHHGVMREAGLLDTSQRAEAPAARGRDSPPASSAVPDQEAGVAEAELVADTNVGQGPTPAAPLILPGQSARHTSTTPQRVAP